MALKVIADDKIPFLKGVLEPFLEIEYVRGVDIRQEMLRDVDALIIRTRTRCDESLLAGTAVKFIATATIGFDHIDTQFCQEAGITWVNAPGCNSGSVMQYFCSALLNYAMDKDIDLSQRVLGIIGLGNVGKKVLKVAEALDMQVVLNDPPRARAEGPCGFISFEGVLREADIITFHVPLNMEGEDRTYHLVNEGLMNKLNPGSILINSSRGEVVDTHALSRMIKEGRVADAILDVWENEPNPDPELLRQTYLATPHIAGYSLDGKAKGTSMSVQALSRFFQLELDDWEPVLPEPEEAIIKIDAGGKSFQRILNELVSKTCNIKNEGEWLSDDPSRFEYYRGAYPVRREFQAYKVKALNMDEPSKRKLRKLGFHLL